MTKNDRAFGNLFVALFYLSAAMIATLIFAAFFPDFTPLHVVLALSGAVVLFVLDGLIHELGHVVFAHISGFKTVAVRFSIFSVTLMPTRSFSVCAPTLCDHTDVVPVKDGDPVGRYALCVIGGPLFALISCSAFAAAFFISQGALKCFFVSFPICFSTLVLNLLPSLLPSSDGTILASLISGEKRKKISDKLGVVRLLYGGATFAEMPKELFALSEKGETEEKLLFALLRAEEKGEYGKMKAILSAFGEPRSLSPETAMDVYAAYCMLKDGEGVAKYAFAAKRCDLVYPLAYVRATVFGASYRGDTAYLGIALPTALSMCDGAVLPGEGKFTRKLIETL